MDHFNFFRKIAISFWIIFGHVVFRYFFFSAVLNIHIHNKFIFMTFDLVPLARRGSIITKLWNLCKSI